MDEKTLGKLIIEVSKFFIEIEPSEVFMKECDQNTLIRVSNKLNYNKAIQDVIKILHYYKKS